MNRSETTEPVRLEGDRESLHIQLLRALTRGLALMGEATLGAASPVLKGGAR